MRLKQKVFFIMAFLHSALCFGEALQIAVPTDLAVYVYDDVGACEEGCAEAAAEVAKHFKLKPVLVTKKDLTTRFFQKLNPLKTVWIQPGGDAIEAAKHLTAEQRSMLRDLISKGAGYLGFCAGGFFADKWVDNENTIPGLNILPGSSHDYLTPEKRMVLPITWTEKNLRGEVIRHMYFEEGGYFEFDEGVEPQVYGLYATGEIAIASFLFEKGHVVLSGPHPEAPVEWLGTVKSNNLTDPDGVDWIYADKLFQAVVPREKLQ